MSASTDKNDQPPQKKIRFSEPDVKVIVGSSDVGSGEVKVFFHHSVLLAYHSGYIDSMLASSLKESESKELTFPDIPPSTWDSMIQWVGDPCAAVTLEFKDALKVAEFYHKYNFHHGVALCDNIFKGRVLTKARSISNVPSKSDAVIDVMEVLHKCGMTEFHESRNSIARWLHKLFNAKASTLSVALTKKRLVRMAPYLAEEMEKNAQLLEQVKPIFDWVKTKDDILCPGFVLHAQLKIQTLDLIHCTDLLAKKMDIALLCFEPAVVDGKFIFTRRNPRDGTPVYTKLDNIEWGNDEHIRRDFTVTIERSEDGWEIIATNEAISFTLWRASEYTNCSLPPLTGWEAVDSQAADFGEVELKWLK